MTPLQSPIPTKHFSITLISSNCCSDFIDLVHSKKNLSQAFMDELRERGIVKTLFKVLNLENEETSFWAISAIYSIFKPLSSKGPLLLSCFSLNYPIVCTSLQNVLGCQSDVTRCRGQKVLCLIFQPNQPHSVFTHKMLESLSAFKSLFYFSKYIERLKHLLKRSEKAVAMMNHPGIISELNQSQIVTPSQHLKSLKESQNQLVYLQTKFSLCELLHVYQVVHSLRKHHAKTGDRVVESITRMDRPNLLQNISDTYPIPPYFHREDLSPVSCIGTVAVISLI